MVGIGAFVVLRRCPYCVRASAMGLLQWGSLIAQECPYCVRAFGNGASAAGLLQRLWVKVMGLVVVWLFAVEVFGVGAVDDAFD